MEKVDSLIEIIDKIHSFLTERLEEYEYDLLTGDQFAIHSINRIEQKLGFCRQAYEQLERLKGFMIRESSPINRGLTKLPKPLESNPQQLLKWLDETLELESTQVKHHALGWSDYRARPLIVSTELVDSLFTDWFTGLPIPDWMANGFGFHPEHAGDPMSLVIEEVTATSNYIALKYAHRLTYECKMELKERRRALLKSPIQEILDTSLESLMNGENDWRITEEDFKRIFDFPLEFKSDTTERYMKERWNELGLPEGSTITFYDIWSRFDDLEVIDSQGHRQDQIGPYTFDEKLAMINDKLWNTEGTGLVNWIQHGLYLEMNIDEATAFAYKKTLEGTKFHDMFGRTERMMHILMILVNNRLINAEKFGKIVDRYSWTKIKVLMNLDGEYPGDLGISEYQEFLNHHFYL